MSTPHALTLPVATAVPASVAMTGMDLTAVCFVFMYIHDCMLHVIIFFMLIYVSIIRNTQCEITVSAMCLRIRLCRW